MEHNPNCALCIREPINEVLWDDDLIWCTICTHPACNCPLIVIKRHSTSPTDDELERIDQVVEHLRSLGYTGRLDCNARAIPDHFHCHLRP